MARGRELAEQWQVPEYLAHGAPAVVGIDEAHADRGQLVGAVGLSDGDMIEAGFDESREDALERCFVSDRQDDDVDGRPRGRRGQPGG